MKKLNVILINSRTTSKLYGIGSYLENLKNELINYSYIRVIYVEIEFGDFGQVLVDNHDYTSIQIRLKTPFMPIISSSCASLIFNTVLLNSNVKDGILHLNGSNDLEIGVVAKEKGFKVVFTQHTELGYHSSKMHDFVDRISKLYSLIDGCIFLCEDEKEKAIRHLSFPPKKAVVIYNGIKLVKSLGSRREIRNNMGFRGDEFIAVFVGRIDKSKGMRELIEAFKRFSKGNLKRKLIIIGDGGFSEVLRMTKENICNFFFTGFLNKSELSNFYQIADIGILPSHSEQSSISVIEMIHNDIPLILSDISGFSIFKEGEVLKTPVLISEESIEVDVDSLYENIKLLYENKNLRKELVKNTLHYKQHLMNIKYSTQQTIKFYKKMLESDRQYF